jgi:hypothetical protein
MSVKAIRGREGATRTKWQNQGWEFVDQTQGALRSELNFRKVKPKGLGVYLAQGYAAFRRLQPRTRKALLGGLTGLVALLVLVIVVAAAGGADKDSPEATQPAFQNEEPEPEPSEEPAEEPTPETKPYSYDGPEYEILIIDENQGPAELTQYWVYTTAKFDLSSDAYKDQVKLIFADIAHEQSTDKFLAEVVTNREIAEAESPSTYEDFIAERGIDYALNTIPKIELRGYVANYTGGYDGDASKPSDTPAAFSIAWRPASTEAEIEQWKPQVPSS